MTKGLDSSLDLAEKEDLIYNHFPRIIESLCPECTKLIKAELSIQGKEIIMEKTCQEHGFFKEILSNDKDFFLRLEKLRFGDGPGIQNYHSQKEKGCPFDCGLCNEHKSTTMMGIIDLTNRCNQKCPICFANSNVSGYVYEPSFEQVKEMMHNLYNLKPAHTPCLQFSGGEPTLHPQFLDIIKEARDIGFTQIQIATNGITIANSEEFARKSSEAGLNVLYLQFDSLNNETYRKIRGFNALEIKKKAIENAKKSDLRIILVPTIAKNSNDKEIGDIIKFAIDNIDIVSAIAFQPIALTGRIDEKEKNKLRFTLTDLARESEKQFPYIKMSDWYPLSIVSPFSRFLETITGQPQSQVTCHSHCGIGTYLFINKEKNQYIPLPRFIDVVGLLGKMQEIYNKNQEKKYFKTLQAKLNILNYAKELEEFYSSKDAPDGMSFNEFLLYLQNFTNKQSFIDNVFKKRNLENKPWKLLILAGMHFQDSFNYETERTQRCVVHYAAPNGKLYPFCSYNSGPCFREQVEKEFAKK